MQIKGQSAVVVGGASGLGAATARLLSSAGAKVAVLDANLEAAQRVAEELLGIAVHCDVTSSASAVQAMSTVEEKQGSARIVVNCAGIAPTAAIIGKNGPMPLDDFRRGVEVNLIGTFNILRLAAQSMASLSTMEDGERGVIINTASIAAFEGQPGQSAYAASKGGVVSLTLAAAREFAPVGIRVCNIAPGMFDTPMLSLLPQPVRAALEKCIPFPQRFGRDEEFAKQVTNIVESVMLNGMTLRMDGALRMPLKWV